MQRLPEQTSVLIIGAGPCGLTLANLLQSYGTDCLVLEREAAPLNLPRAIVLDDEGFRTLQIFGLDESYLPRTLRGTGSLYIGEDGQAFAETGAGPLTYGFSKRSFIHQPDLERALTGALLARNAAALRYNAEVTAASQTPDGVCVTVNTPQGPQDIRAAYVVACDGGRSPMRERLGIAMEGETYAQDWIVVDSLNDPDDDPRSKFFCSSARPAVSVPAPNGGRRYEFMLQPGETREEALSTPFLQKLLTPFRPWREEDFLRRTVYTFHARMAARWREGRIFLAGDAAHLTPPFAGQGMNAGLRDATNLAWKLAAMLKAPRPETLAASYEQERRGPADDMIRLAVAMGSIVMPGDAAGRAFRDLLLQALKPFPAVRDYLIQMRFKPKPHYTDGLLLGAQTPEFEGSLVGAMIPQPRMSDGRLLDHHLGSGFALIGVGAETAAALSQVGRSALCGLPLAAQQMSWRGSEGLASPDAALMRAFATHRGQILLIRPDRYCAAAFWPADLARGLADYEALCGF